MSGLTRTEFMARLGMIRVVDPMVDSAYEIAEREVDHDSHSSGFDWSTAFHAADFPADDPYACPRQALYGLLGVKNDPIDRRGRMFMDAGKNLELELVRRFGHAGWLLTADQTGDDEFQTNFVDRDMWLSGSPDLIVIPPGWDRGHVVEVKGKAQQRPPRYKVHHDPVAEMRSMIIGPTKKHVKQLGAYIGMANREFHRRVPYVWVCRRQWSIIGFDPDRTPTCSWHGRQGCAKLITMKPVVDGTLYYVALDDGTVTHEYFYSLDRRGFATGRSRLAEWRQNFIDGELPPRPDDWLWSRDPYPCRLCPYKGTKTVDGCKKDDQEGVTRLADSNTVKTAKAADPGYDYDRQREKVLGRWKEDHDG